MAKKMLYLTYKHRFVYKPHSSFYENSVLYTTNSSNFCSPGQFFQLLYVRQISKSNLLGTVKVYTVSGKKRGWSFFCITFTNVDTVS